MKQLHITDSWHEKHGVIEGTDIKSFAQGMLQFPSFHELYVNMVHLIKYTERKNDGTQIYNYDPNMPCREKIDHYMKKS